VFAAALVMGLLRRRQRGRELGSFTSALERR
jgi:hypothetical protein